MPEAQAAMEVIHSFNVAMIELNQNMTEMVNILIGM
jgi:hypothetical protein